MSYFAGYQVNMITHAFATYKFHTQKEIQKQTQITRWQAAVGAQAAYSSWADAFSAAILASRRSSMARTASRILGKLGVPVWTAHHRTSSSLPPGGMHTHTVRETTTTAPSLETTSIDVPRPVVASQPGVALYPFEHLRRRRQKHVSRHELRVSPQRTHAVQSVY